MAVRRMNTIQGYALPQQEGLFPVPGRQPSGNPYASLQVQDWTKGLDYESRKYNSVVTETARTLPVFSSRGIRRDVLLITLTLVLVLFFSVLFSDLAALNAGGQRIGQLSAGITTLENHNALLQEQLSLSLRNASIGATVNTITLPEGMLTGSLP